MPKLAVITKYHQKEIKLLPTAEKGAKLQKGGSELL
jgi:hypothetical protein